jgi:imidazolonepropionase-like amidohydrolase
MREMAEREFLRLPASPGEAREMLRELAGQRVDGIKAVLETGHRGTLFERMDVTILAALADEARTQGLPLMVHTGDARDVADAIDVGAAGVEHGSFREPLSDELVARLVASGTTYNPTLSVAEAFSNLGEGNYSLLSRSLVEQVAPPGMIEATRTALRARHGSESASVDMELANNNLWRVYQAGGSLVAGTDSGNPMLLHGPAIHRELQLWVAAGVPPAVALKAATYDAAKLLRVEDRIGLIEPGYDANLLIVDGNPLETISSTERISTVFFQGEWMDRPSLLEAE